MFIDQVASELDGWSKLSLFLATQNCHSRPNGAFQPCIPDAGPEPFIIGFPSPKTAL